MKDLLDLKDLTVNPKPKPQTPNPQIQVGVKRKKEKELVKWDKEMDTIKSRFEAQGNLSCSDLEVPIENGNLEWLKD